MKRIVKLFKKGKITDNVYLFILKTYDEEYDLYAKVNNSIVESFTLFLIDKPVEVTQEEETRIYELLEREF